VLAHPGGVAPRMHHRAQQVCGHHGREHAGHQQGGRDRQCRYCVAREAAWGRQWRTCCWWARRWGPEWGPQAACRRSSRCRRFGRSRSEEPGLGVEGSSCCT
jgi:hypothetical protein